MQKSLREGFGLTIAEGLWKGKPVIGGNVGGIPLQIEEGVTGYLVGLGGRGERARAGDRCATRRKPSGWAPWGAR